MRFLGLALAAVVAAIATPAIALADVTYKLVVPITVSNLNPGQLVQVECDVYSAIRAQGPILATGEGATVNADANGSYSGKSTVAVTSSTLPASYKCWIIVYASKGTSTANIVNGVPESAQPGWTGTMLTTGNF